MTEPTAPGPDNTDAPGALAPEPAPAAEPAAPTEPIVPEKYDLTRPEGIGEEVEIDLDGFTAAAKELKWTQEVAQANAAVLYHYAAGAVARHSDALKAQEAATEKAWADALAADPKAAETTAYMDKALLVGTPEERAAIQSANPLVRSFLAKIGRGISEPAPLPGVSGGRDLTSSERARKFFPNSNMA